MTAKELAAAAWMAAVVMLMLMALPASWVFASASQPATPPAAPVINLSCPGLPEIPAAPACPGCVCEAQEAPDLPLIVLDVMAIREAHRYHFATEDEGPYVCRHYARDLYELMSSQGFRPQVCWSKTHAWVELGGMVLDLTLEKPFVNPEDWKHYDGYCSSGGPPEWWYG